MKKILSVILTVVMIASMFAARIVIKLHDIFSTDIAL